MDILWLMNAGPSGTGALVVLSARVGNAQLGLGQAYSAEVLWGIRLSAMEHLPHPCPPARNLSKAPGKAWSWAAMHSLTSQ